MSDRAFLFMGHAIMLGVAIAAVCMLGHSVATVSLGKVFGFGSGVMACVAYDMGRDVLKFRRYIRNGGRQ